METTGKKRVYVSVGSNIDKEHNIPSGVKMMREAFGDLELSPVYESNSVGFEGESFYNMVVSFETDRSPSFVTDALKGIENRHHRKRNKNRFESRTLDLDQILHGDLVIDEADIRIPHEDIVRYAFVLRPLADIASQVKHPILSKTYIQLWTNFKDGTPSLEKVPLAFTEGGRNLNSTASCRRQPRRSAR